jgi:N12 class adenine-specific DNA methylase
MDTSDNTLIDERDDEENLRRLRREQLARNVERVRAFNAQAAATDADTTQAQDTINRAWQDDRRSQLRQNLDRVQRFVRDQQTQAASQLQPQQRGSSAAGMFWEELVNSSVGDQARTNRAAAEMRQASYGLESQPVLPPTPTPPPRPVSARTRFGLNEPAPDPSTAAVDELYADPPSGLGPPPNAADALRGNYFYPDEYQVSPAEVGGSPGSLQPTPKPTGLGPDRVSVSATPPGGFQSKRDDDLVSRVQRGVISVLGRPLGLDRVDPSEVYAEALRSERDRARLNLDAAAAALASDRAVFETIRKAAFGAAFPLLPGETEAQRDDRAMDADNPDRAAGSQRQQEVVQALLDQVYSPDEQRALRLQKVLPADEKQLQKDRLVEQGGRQQQETAEKRADDALRLIPRQGIVPEVAMSLRDNIAVGGRAWLRLAEGAAETAGIHTPGEISEFMRGAAAFARASGQDPYVVPVRDYTARDVTKDPSLLIDPRYLGQVVFDQAPLMATMIASGNAAGVMARAMGMARAAGFSARAAATAASYMVEAGSHIREVRENLRTRGLPEDEINRIAGRESMAYGAVAAFLEMAPIAKYLGKNPGGKRGILGFVQQALEEGTTEAMQSASESIAAVVGHGEDISLVEAVRRAINEGAAGLAVGGATEAAAAGVGDGARLRRRPTSAAPTDEAIDRYLAERGRLNPSGPATPLSPTQQRPDITTEPFNAGDRTITATEPGASGVAKTAPEAAQQAEITRGQDQGVRAPDDARAVDRGGTDRVPTPQVGGGGVRPVVETPGQPAGDQPGDVGGVADAAPETTQQAEVMHGEEEAVGAPSEAQAQLRQLEGAQGGEDQERRIGDGRGTARKQQLLPPPHERQPEKQQAEVMHGSEEVVNIDKIPSLVGADQQGAMIRLSFDSASPAPSAQELKQKLGEMGYDVSVTRHNTDIISGTQGTTNYRIDVFSKERLSTKKAVELLDRLTDGRGAFREDTQFEQLGDLEQRMTAAQRSFLKNSGPTFDPVAQPTPTPVPPTQASTQQAENDSPDSGVDAAEPQQREYSSTQLNLPKPVADKVRAVAATIPDADLAEGGRETTPHITVQYGLTTDQAEEVARAVAGVGPVVVKLGKVSSFAPSEGSGGAEVVKVDVAGPALATIRERIRETLQAPGDKFDTYKAHVTLAYVKKGLGQKYVGRSDLAGQHIRLDRLVFSSKTGEQIEIPLTKGAADANQQMQRQEEAAPAPQRTDTAAQVTAPGEPQDASGRDGGAPGPVARSSWPWASDAANDIARGDRVVAVSGTKLKATAYDVAAVAPNNVVTARGGQNMRAESVIKVPAGVDVPQVASARRTRDVAAPAYGRGRWSEFRVVFADQREQTVTARSTQEAALQAMRTRMNEDAKRADTAGEQPQDAGSQPPAAAPPTLPTPQGVREDGDKPSTVSRRALEQMVGDTAQTQAAAPQRKRLSQMTRAERKAFWKTAVAPDTLPETPDAYFDLSQPHEMVDVADLIPIKSPEQQADSVRNAIVFMAASAEDQDGKRKPITVIALEKNGKRTGKYLVVDGNATFGAASKLAWARIPAQVLDAENGIATLAGEIKDDDARLPMWDAYAHAAGKPGDTKNILAKSILSEVLAEGKPGDTGLVPTERQTAEMIEGYAKAIRARKWFSDRVRGLAEQFGRDSTRDGKLSDQLVADIGFGPGVQDGMAIGPVKQPHRWLRKMAEKSAAGKATTALAEGKDLLRSTVVVNHRSGIDAVLAALADESITDAAVVKDRWTEDGEIVSKWKANGNDPGYRDILINLQSPEDGLVVEVQFNVPEMLATKHDRGHDLYQNIERLTRETQADPSNMGKQQKLAEAYEESQMVYAEALDLLDARMAATASSNAALLQGTTSASPSKNMDRRNQAPAGRQTPSSPITSEDTPKRPARTGDRPSSSQKLVESDLEAASPTEDIIVETPPSVKQNPAKPSVLDNLSEADRARLAEIKARFLKKIQTELRTGFDPDLMALATEIGYLHIKAGAKAFAAFARSVVDDMGAAAKPYLKAMYLGGRNLPGVDRNGMDSADTVEAMTEADIDAALSAQTDQESAPAAPAPGKATGTPSEPKGATGRQTAMAGQERAAAETEYMDVFRPQLAHLLPDTPPADLSAALGVIRDRVLSDRELSPNAVVHNASNVMASLAPDRQETQGQIAIILRNAAENVFQWAAQDDTMQGDEGRQRRNAGAAPGQRREDAGGDDVEPGAGGQGPARRVRERGGTRPGRRAEPRGGRTGPTVDDGGGQVDLAADESAASGEPVEGRPQSGRQSAGPGRDARARLNPQDRNYEITEDVAPTTNTRRWQANIAALELLNRLEEEGRNPTPDEKQVLARYTGWGWNAEFFNEKYNPDSRWHESDKYTPQYQQLRSLMTEEEFASARASTTNAHFTSIPVIKGMWKAVQRMGFAGGVVMEPSAGVGHFFGAMPQDLVENSRLVATELDSLTARIAKLLYPEADVQGIGFEESRAPVNSVDLLISNVPFGNVKVPGATDYPELTIHNYFFMRALDKAKPGGLVAFITSAFTLNAKDPRVRKQIAERADLVGAIRLPNTAQKAVAGTEVTTDIVFLRKKGSTPWGGGQSWINTVQVGADRVDGKEVPIVVNEYFEAHPEMVLGTHSMQGSMQAKRGSEGEYTVEPFDGKDLGDLMREAVKRLPKDLPEAEYMPPIRGVGEQAPAGVKEGSYVERDGITYRVVSGKMEEPEWLTIKGYGDNWERAISAQERSDRIIIAKRWMALRDATMDLFAAENTPDTSNQALGKKRKALNQLYDAYVKDYGALTRPAGQLHLEKARFLLDDPDYMIQGLLEDEVVEQDQQTGRAKYRYEKSGIFTRRIREPKAMPATAASVDDAITVSLGYHNKIDAAVVAGLLGVTEEEARARLLQSPLVFEDHETGGLQLADLYLSGNVRKKLEAAREAAKDDPAYERNVAALEAVQPEPVPLESIYVQLGSRWVPDNVLGAFASELMGTPASVTYQRILNDYSVELANLKAPGNEVAWATSKMSGRELLRHALNGTKPTVTKQVERSPGEYSSVTDREGTKAAQKMIERMQDEFVRWARGTDTQVEYRGEMTAASRALEREYNRVNNAMVPPAFNGDYLVLPGASDFIRRRPYRMAAVARGLQTGAAVLAHGVGSGKTITQIILAMEHRRLGLAKKPLIVVQKATLNQFANEFRKAYPDARIMVADERSFSKKNRERFFARAAVGDYDAVIVTQPQLKKIPNRPGTIAVYLSEQISAYDEAIRSEAAQSLRGGGGRNADYNRNKSPSQKRLEAAKRNMEAKLQAILADASKLKDNALFFEDLGVDMLSVDEAHAFKAIPIATRMTDIKGIPNQHSQQAVDLQIKAKSIQDRNNGRGVFLATGTPITNTMAEAYVMLKVATPTVLEEYNISNFDEFARTFGVTVEGLEVAAGNRIKFVSRFRRFVNGPELINLIRSGFDIAMGNKELGLDVPEVRGGKPEMVAIEPTEADDQVNDYLTDIVDRYEGLEGQERFENSWVIITAMQAGMAGAVDPRLILPDAPDLPGSKLNTAVENIAKIYRETGQSKGTQLVFVDRFTPMNTARLDEFSSGRPTRDAPAIVEGDEINLDGLEVAKGQIVEPDTQGESDYEDEAAAARIKQEQDAYDTARFNVYQEIKAKLVAKGVPAGEVAIIHDAKNDNQRAKLFDQVNAGIVRVLLGSTEKMGVGVNVQAKLIAAHHLDPPRMMTPAMLTQRNGRIIRQGNPNQEVRILYYGLKDSMDAAIYQKLEQKDRFISQVWSRGVGRQFEDAAGEVAVSAAEMKAVLQGNPLLVRLVELQQKLRAIGDERDAFLSEKAAARRDIGGAESAARSIEQDMATAQARYPKLAEALPPGDGIQWSIRVGEQTYTERDDAVRAIDAAWERVDAAAMKDWQKTKHGSAHATIQVNGLRVQIASQTRTDGASINARNYAAFAGAEARAWGGSIVDGASPMLTSMRQTISRIPAALERERQAVATQRARAQALREVAARTWDGEAELARLQKEVDQIEIALAAGKSVLDDSPTSAELAAAGVVVRPGEERARARRQRRTQAGAGDVLGSERVQRGSVPKQPVTPVRPSSPGSGHDPKTDGGKKLVAAIRQDTTGRNVGMRSIVRYLTDLTRSELRVGLEQTSSRHPANYLGSSYHLIRAKTDTFQLNFHEAGHAIATLVRDKDPNFLDNLGGRIAAMAEMPGSMASGKGVDEGFAEWTRRYVVDPTSIPREVTKRVEAALKQHAPEVLDGLHDARLALAAHLARDPDAVFASYMHDKPKRPSLQQAVVDSWHRFLYSLSAGTVLNTRVRNRVFGAIRKQSLTLARHVDTQLADSPADYRNAYQMTLHVPQEVNRAIFGTKKGDEGLRVISTGGDPFRLVMDGLDASEQMRFVTRFKLPKMTAGARHGDYIRLNNYSIQSVIDAVGREHWDEFEIYGWRRAALSRYEKDGQRYPGLTEGQTPAVMKQQIAKAEAAHPDWSNQFKRINDFMDQLLLVSVLSGELTVTQAMDIAEAHDSYWPLPRSLQRTPSKRSGKGAEPTAGIYRAYGSDIPFANILDAIDARVRMAYESYYANRTLLAVHRVGRQMAEMKQLPLEARLIAGRLMTPLQLDWKKMTTLNEAEQAQAVADYLNQETARQKQVGVEQLDSADLVNPDDVVINFPGADVWRQVKPRAIRVVAPWVNGQRAYFQIEDPVLFEFFARTRKPIEALANFAKVMQRVVRPWKRGITHTWPFAIWNVFVRDPATAMILGDGSDKVSWIPAGYIAVALINRITGKTPLAISQSELLSKALDGTNSKAHQTHVQKFLNVLSEGVLLDDYGRMSPGQRMMELPGQTASAIAKPIDLVNYLTGARAFSEFTESLSREGAFIRAKQRGLSDEAAQAQYDFVTGNFGEQSGGPTLAAMFRAAGFFNPGIQILVQTYGKAANVDRAVRGELAVKMGWLMVLGGVSAALNYLLLDDDDKDEMKERTDEDRGRYMNVSAPFFRGVRLRLPFDYGPAGAATSLGWNLVEGYLLGDSVDGKAQARAVLERALSLPAVVDVMGPQLKTALELSLGDGGYSFFFDGPIVPTWQVTSYPNNPELRAYDNTPDFYMWMGQQLRVSPLKVQYALRNAVNPQLDDAVQTIQRFIDTRPPEEPAAWPYIGRLFQRHSTGWKAKSVRDLSDLEEAYQAAVKIKKHLETMGDPSDTERLNELQTTIDKLRGHYQAMRDVRLIWRNVKAERAKPSPNQKRIERLEQEMAAQARRHFLIEPAD